MKTLTTPGATSTRSMTCTGSMLAGETTGSPMVGFSGRIDDPSTHVARIHDEAKRDSTAPDALALTRVGDGAPQWYHGRGSGWPRLASPRQVMEACATI